MNKFAISAVVSSMGRSIFYSANSDGIVGSIRLTKGEHCGKQVNALLPIDDESDVRFAKFLVSEAERLEQHRTDKGGKR